MSLNNLSASGDAPDLKIRGLGKELWPYQSAGVEYAMRSRRLIIADQMGLGKTVQALATIQALDAYPAVVVCPADAKPAWKREIKDWLPGVESVIVDSKTTLPPVRDGQRIILVLNYDIVSRFAGKITGGIKPRAVIGDEAHYVKNKKAQRTKAFKSISKSAHVKILLTGTPIENRPMEYLSLLEILGRAQDFGGAWYFLNRYCDAKRDHFGFWDFSGASNLVELNQRLRSLCYIRRLKGDVQRDLPEQRTEIVPIEISNRADYDNAEADLISWLIENRTKDAAERAMKAEAMVKIETLKQIAALGKLVSATEWIARVIESGEKLVVFVHHQEIARLLKANFPDAAMFTGETPAKLREANRIAFQTDPAQRLLIVSIAVGGVGIDLTSASNCLFLELAWTPSKHEQAESRLHRHGQTRDVTAWYMLAEGTIDEEIFGLLRKKREIIHQAVDGEGTDNDLDILMATQGALLKKGGV